MLTRAIERQIFDTDGLGGISLALSDESYRAAFGLFHPDQDVFGPVHPFWRFEGGEIPHPEVIVCSVVLGLSGVLCSAAGIGGGGIYVSALMVAGRLGPHEAVPLSKAVVFMGATVTLIMNLGRDFASSKAPNIDFDVCRLVVPMALMGTLLGVLLNPITPDWLIVSLLLLTLIFMTISVSLKGYRQYKAENEANQNIPTVDQSGKDLPNPQVPEADTPQHAGGDLELEGLEKKDQAKGFPYRDAIASLIVLIIVICGGIVRFLSMQCRMEKQGLFPKQRNRGCDDPILNLFFAGRMTVWMSHHTSAVIVQVVAIGIPVSACLFLSYFATRRAIDAKRADLTVLHIMAYKGMSLVTGCLAGLVGIGGGLIFSPFFLMMGLHPAMSVATSSTCVIFTSSSTTMQYIFTDRIIMSLALVYGLVNFVASYTGTKLVHRLQEKSRPSYITFIVAIGVGISAALTVDKFVVMIRHMEHAAASFMQVRSLWS